MVVNGTISRDVSRCGATIYLEVAHENGRRYLFTVDDVRDSKILATGENALAITWWCWGNGGVAQVWSRCPTRDEVRSALCMRAPDPDDRDPPIPQGDDLDAVHSIISSIFGVRP